MGLIDYQVLLADLIKPLVSHPDEVCVEIKEQNDNHMRLVVLVNENDKGRIIGKKGRIANAIRTIVHAASVRDNMHIDIDMGKDESAEE